MKFSKKCELISFFYRSERPKKQNVWTWTTYLSLTGCITMFNNYVQVINLPIPFFHTSSGDKNNIHLTWQTWKCFVKMVKVCTNVSWLMMWFGEPNKSLILSLTDFHFLQRATTITSSDIRPQLPCMSFPETKNWLHHILVKVFF